MTTRDKMQIFCRYFCGFESIVSASNAAQALEPWNYHERSYLADFLHLMIGELYA